MNKITKIAYLIILTFSFLGMFNFSMVSHEISHRQDFKEYVEDSEMCIWYVGEEMENTLAYYSMTFKPHYLEKIEEIGKWSEYKAYGIQLLIMGVWLYCFKRVWQDE